MRALATEGPQQPASSHAALRAPSPRGLGGGTPRRTLEHAHCVQGQASPPAGLEARSAVTSGAGPRAPT